MGTESRAWEEVYEGGTPEAEAAVFEDLARRIRAIQQGNAAKAHGAAQRTLHAKPIYATGNASFDVRPDLPGRLAQGFFQPGAKFRATLRLSNASGIAQSDGAADMRGAAIRVHLPGAMQDFLMTNFPVSHARNARQFVEFAEAAAGPRALLPFKLLFSQGLGETLRMLGNIRAAIGRPVASIALETFWSRGALLWGEAGPVRYLLRPAADAPPAMESAGDLRTELLKRLSRPVRYEFCVQPFIDAASTPIEDGAVEWTEAISPPQVAAILTVPPQARETRDSEESRLEKLAFNPWNCAPMFRPLGNINRARRSVYWASADGRGAER